MKGRPVKLAIVGAALAAVLSGCALTDRLSCPNGGRRATAELVFGRVSSDGTGGVSEAQFADFLDKEVSPRFPDGLTVIDAEGRWKPPAGSSIREPAKIVDIVLPGHLDDRGKLDAVRSGYKARFHQQSVLLMTHGDCVSF